MQLPLSLDLKYKNNIFFLIIIWSSYNYFLRYERSVGFNISTKAVGSRERQVLTNDYKYPENSSEERQAWKNAYGNSSRPDYFKKFLEVEKNQLKVKTSTRISNPENGKDVTINISVENISENDKTLMISSSMWSCYYTGSKKTNIYNYTQGIVFKFLSFFKFIAKHS